MQCTEVQPLFTEFADNTLAREELHALTDHLLGCPACAVEWQEFQQTLRLVHSLEPLVPPGDLLPGIHAKLAKKGIFYRAWTFIDALNFSLSIPAAAAIFTIAMLGGFMLTSSPLQQTNIFPSPLARTSSLPQGEILATRRPALAPNLMFAVSHNEARLSGDLEPLARTPLTTHPAPDNHARRLLSPDLHVLIKDIDRDSRITLCREMLHRNWQLHRVSASLFLVHLPQSELRDFHNLIGHHHFVLVPAAAVETRFGNEKQILTAAIRFQ
jgi:hypothetical protein